MIHQIIKGTFLNYVIRLGWVGVQKRWNLQLLSLLGGWVSQKSEIVHYFSLQISDHTFFVTSQLLKQEKRACWFWTIVKQKNVVLSSTTVLLSWQKEKKLLTSFVCFLLSSFWKKKQIWKRQKQNSAVLFLKASVLCFVFWPWANFAWNKMRRALSFKSKLCKERLCFSFSLVNQTS